ncbi:hypothetical protein AVEN_235694-1 [Araneus ventricosus]|uniref:Uncharacterized protein n=1 Tax=Araneus ventricosus TaxID=182803 RepID=A0A4Y2RPL2_ARAVE|nr:hypothetical protein AVEN_235694-1 [Araneus ventricosus]
MEEDSTSTRRCPCCNCKKNNTKEEAIETFSEKRFSGDPRQETFCNAVFLPEFVRRFIRKQGERPEDEERKPVVKKTSGIVLTFEIPGRRNSTFFLFYLFETLSSLNHSKWCRSP